MLKVPGGKLDEVCPCGSLCKYELSECPWCLIRRGSVKRARCVRSDTVHDLIFHLRHFVDDEKPAVKNLWFPYSVVIWKNYL